MKKKVLIIDDEPDILSLIELRLQSQQFECLKATNASDGLSLVTSLKPDVILLDLCMNGMSGYGFLREIKKLPDEVASIPVIVYSAVYEEEIVREAFNLGARGYLKKSCPVEELMTMVKENAL